MSDMDPDADQIYYTTLDQEPWHPGEQGISMRTISLQAELNCLLRVQAQGRIHKHKSLWKAVLDKGGMIEDQRIK